MTQSPSFPDYYVIYDHVTLYERDARDLGFMREGSVHTVITSPPYFNDRDYMHDEQIGLEASVEEYLDGLAQIGEQVWRVLRDDGVFWLNLGDAHVDKSLGMVPFRVIERLKQEGWLCKSVAPWMKRKHLPSSAIDRINVSHEYIFMLVKSRGPLFWTHPKRNGVRSKPEPDWAWKHRGSGEVVLEDPEDDTGLIWMRFNRWVAHDYYYDRHAVLRPLSDATVPRLMRGIGSQNRWIEPDEMLRAHNFLRSRPEGGVGTLQDLSGRNWRTIDVWEASVRDTAVFYRTYADYLEQCLDGQGSIMDMEGDFAATIVNPKGYRGGHYATFPQALIADPLAATTPQQVCNECGAPWFRIVEEHQTDLVEIYEGMATKDYEKHLAQDPSETKRSILKSISRVPLREHLSPTCECAGNDGSMRARVLDPMVGSGTVAIECVKTGHTFVGIDISKDTLADAEERILKEGYGVNDDLKGTPFRQDLFPV